MFPVNEPLQEKPMRASTLRRRLAPFASSVALSLLSCTALAQPSAIDRVVIFGASLSDTGNSFIWLSDPAQLVAVTAK